MGNQRGVVRLPGRVTATAGIVLTLGLVCLAVGWVDAPAFLHPASRSDADIERAAREAETVWRASAREIISAKIAAGLAPAGGGASFDGLLGDEQTPLVTTLGLFEAKQIGLSAAWPGVMARQLAAAGLRRGDLVAASFSGSFPGLNLAVITACRALGLDIIAVSSVTASSWGANQPGFTWPEMECRLVASHHLTAVSVAISAGGESDRARDLDPDGRRLADAIAGRTAAALGAVRLEPLSFTDAIAQRLNAFDDRRGPRRLAAFINVGGTEAALGRSTAILRVASGWIPGRPFDTSAGRGLVARMAERGVPVLHVLNVRELAARWGVL
jgi:poly-gamma-glutamate system protein